MFSNKSGKDEPGLKTTENRRKNGEIIKIDLVKKLYCRRRLDETDRMGEEEKKILPHFVLAQGTKSVRTVYYHRFQEYPLESEMDVIDLIISFLAFLLLPLSFIFQFVFLLLLLRLLGAAKKR